MRSRDGTAGLRLRAERHAGSSRYPRYLAAHDVRRIRGRIDRSSRARSERSALASPDGGGSMAMQAITWSR